MLKKYFYKICNWVLHTKFYARFAASYLAYYTFRCWGWPKLNMASYFKIREIVLKGGGAFAFVSADKYILNYRFNRAFTRCTFGHAGYIYIGDDHELHILHMKEKGLERDYLINLMREVDSMAIVMFPTIKNLDAIKKMQWVPYDFDMNSPDKLYCSELVATVLESNNIAAIQRSVYGGRKFVTPDNVYRSGVIVFDERH